MCRACLWRPHCGLWRLLVDSRAAGWAPAVTGLGGRRGSQLPDASLRRVLEGAWGAGSPPLPPFWELLHCCPQETFWL